MQAAPAARSTLRCAEYSVEFGPLRHASCKIYRSCSSNEVSTDGAPPFLRQATLSEGGRDNFRYANAPEMAPEDLVAEARLRTSNSSSKNRRARH